MSRSFTRAMRLGAAAALSIAALPSAAAHAAPGVPAPPVSVYNENFENVAHTTVPELLTSYVGAPTLNATYTAHPNWVSPALCNGIVTSANSAGYPGCGSNALVGNIAHILGLIPGNGGDAGHALSAATAGNPGADNVEFETVGSIPLATANRFLTFSVDAAALNCFADGTGHPLYKFYLLNGMTAIPTFTTPINACTDTRGTFIPGANGGGRYGRYASNGSALFTGTSIGIRLVNGQGTGVGNDAGIDNVTILDATPTLDKEFSPTRINASNQVNNSTTTLTFTITNTTDLAAKNGWSFTDSLPAGLSRSGIPGGTCTGVTVSGSTAVSVSGNLSAGEVSCTVTVPVRAAAPGSYTNGPSNVSQTGLNPPTTSSSVSVNVPPTATINSPVENADYFVGQQVPVNYSCADSDGTVASCVGSQPNGAILDTSAPGVNSFTVEAADNEGALGSAVAHYRVHPVLGFCRGSSLRLPLNLLFGVANEPITPCVTASKQDLNVNSITGNPTSLLGSLVNASTLLIQANGLLGASGPGVGSAAASTDLTNVSIKVLGLTIALNAVHSDAKSQLTSCSSAVTTGSSRIARLTINGAPINVAADQPVTLPLGIGTLYLNQRATGANNSITMRTLFLDLPGTALDVILGESIAGAVCGPLPPEAP